MDALIGLAMLGLVILVYFLPSIVAWDKGRANLTAIAILNLLLGWTFVGWVVALVWALTKPAVITVVAPPASK